MVRGDGHHLHGTAPPEPPGPGGSVVPVDCLCPLQELEKLEVERIEWIQTHLRQYTTLRHETDMFNQSVSPPVPSQTRVFLPPEVLLLFSGGGTRGPAAAEGGSGKRPRALGQGEQDRRGPTRGYGHIGPSGPDRAGLGRAGPSVLPRLRTFGHLDITPGLVLVPTGKSAGEFSSQSGRRRQTSMFPRSRDVIAAPNQTHKSAD